MRSGSRAGPTNARSGPEVAHANLSARQAQAAMLLTSATYGHTFSGSSASARLQSSLESRLRARLDADGSPEYVLTWKHWDLQSGLPICALRASQRRTSGKEFIGWPTPMAQTKAQGGNNRAGNSDSSRRTVQILKGWASPKASNGTGAGQRGTGGENLQTQVLRLRGWASPRANRFGNADSHGNNQKPLNATMAGVVLNPEHNRWLMGYPIDWTRSADMATRSSRKSRKSSSKA